MATQLELDLDAASVPISVTFTAGKPVINVAIETLPPDPPAPGGAEMAWRAMLAEVWAIIRDTLMQLAQGLREHRLQPPKYGPAPATSTAPPASGA